MSGSSKFGENTMSSEQGVEEKEEIKKGEEGETKIDVKKLVSIIPPPATLFSKQKSGVREKRLRLKYDSSVKEGEAKVSSMLAREMGIKDYIEVTVAGRKRIRLKVVIVDELDANYVNVNPDQMKHLGVSDNSICTIRPA
uniref:Uncharacterized protein n=1 Tax=Ignisphaera aggregans TaxID=334771 RepID=A0A7J3JNG7_9CREN